ncbi:hypothetical protein ABDK56_02945 [Sphingomonas sp. ASV193]|uniref:hypothetical protein n=1 Tax=Sphingomonas sp. ASV193 TaxID=3144405 RepID=UPI0032E8FFC7
MAVIKFSYRVLAASAAASLLATPVLAAVPAPASPVAPMVALSALASDQSRNALCSAAAADAAGTAAAAAAANGSGQGVAAGPCLFPVAEAPAPVAMAPAAVAPAPGFPLGLVALLGVAGAAVIAALTLFKNNNDIRTPLSPA